MLAESCRKCCGLGLFERDHVRQPQRNCLATVAEAYIAFEDNCGVVYRATLRLNMMFWLVSERYRLCGLVSTYARRDDRSQVDFHVIEGS